MSLLSKLGITGSGGLFSNYMRFSGGLVDGLLGTNFVGDYDATKNLDLAKANLEYQKWVQQQTWNREDTAVQRRTADLKAAGFNPLLAAGGNGAASGAVVNTVAPARVTQKYNPLEKIAVLTGIDKTLAETAVLGATKDNLGEQNSNLQAQNALLKAQTIKAIADATGWTTEEVAFKFFGYKSSSVTKRPAVGKTEREQFFDDLKSGKTPLESWLESNGR